MPRDVLIVGAGPVGLALALALRDSGLAVTLADARSRDAVQQDQRVLALAQGTRLTLEQMGAWPAAAATPISTIHISQQGGFGRTRLRAEDYELPALGYVLPAGALTGTLRAAVDAAGIEVLDETKVSTLATDTAEVIATLDDAHAGIRRLSARLVACAEGALTGAIQDVIERDYDQHAIIAHVTPDGGHRNVAFERFTPSGPIALLPCGKNYALVHVVPPQTADALLELDDAKYLAHLQACFGGRVRLSAVTGRLRFPLGLRYRRTPTGQRTVWLGNAAQTLHPVAGQGFNLALRDVHALADTLMKHPGDPGNPATLAAYARARKLDRSSTIHFTDALVRLFSNDSGPLRHLRGAGLFALDMLPPLRHFIARRMMFGARAWP